MSKEKDIDRMTKAELINYACQLVVAHESAREAWDIRMQLQRDENEKCLTRGKESFIRRMKEKENVHGKDTKLWAQRVIDQGAEQERAMEDKQYTIDRQTKEIFDLTTQCQDTHKFKGQVDALITVLSNVSEQL